MGQTDVTVGQFRQFVKATGYQTQAEREGALPRFPEWGFKTTRYELAESGFRPNRRSSGGLRQLE